MSFATLPLALVLLGLLGLAALLFVLQRLRVRHRQLEVVTTLFWREAVLDTRARVFVQRFRHPLAYALLLVIAALLWLAVGTPTVAAGERREHVLVLDASAGMGFGGRFADATGALRARAAALPRAHTRVLWAGAATTTLLDRGEELALLERRLAGRGPEAVPAAVERALFELAAGEPAPGTIAVEVFGDAPVTAQAQALLAPRLQLQRAPLAAFERREHAGVVALGVTEAASGVWQNVDVLVELAGDRAHERPQVLLDGAPAPGVESDPTGAGTVLRLRDLPARSGRLEVKVARGDAFAADDHAAVVLPDRTPVRVAIAAGVPPVVRAALASDAGIAIAEPAAADVVIRAAGEAFGGALPALELAGDESGPAFVVRRVRVAHAERELRESFELLGLAEIDSTALATQAGRPIELSLEAGEPRAVVLWASLLGDAYDFRQLRAFPLFLARSLRWLADVQPVPFQVAAGDWARDGSTRMTLEGRALDAVGADLRVPSAGDLTGARGTPVHASLLDPAATLGAPADGLAAGAAPASFGGELLPVLLLAALGLLAVEWWLVRKERIP